MWWATLQWLHEILFLVSGLIASCIFLAPSKKSFRCSQKIGLKLVLHDSSKRSCGVNLCDYMTAKGCNSNYRLTAAPVSTDLVTVVLYGVWTQQLTNHLFPLCSLPTTNWQRSAKFGKKTNTNVWKSSTAYLTSWLAVSNIKTAQIGVSRSMCRSFSGAQHHMFNSLVSKEP